MNLRRIGTYGVAVALILATTTQYDAQVSRRARSKKARSRTVPTSSAPSSSASHVAAEVSEGRLNPAASKPGDTIVLKLKEDLKSNGDVVLKKGTPITGVVRNVAPSMMADRYCLRYAERSSGLFSSANRFLAYSGQLRDK